MVKMRVNNQGNARSFMLAELTLGNWIPICGLAVAAIAGIIVPVILHLSGKKRDGAGSFEAELGDNRELMAMFRDLLNEYMKEKLGVEEDGGRIKRETERFEEIIKEAGRAYSNQDYERAEKIWEEIYKKHMNKVRRRPFYNNWGSTLLKLAKQKDNKEKRDQFLRKAAEKYKEAEKVTRGIAAHNLAHIYELLGEEEERKYWVQVVKESEGLPSRRQTVVYKSTDEISSESASEASITLKRVDNRGKLTPYCVFIASPDGLEAEREIFYDELKDTNDTHAKERGVIFEGIGWEDIPPTYKRSQEAINEELRKCDYYVLVLWDRWGSNPNPGVEWKYSSGSEEEYYEAKQCVEGDYLMQDIAVFFKEIGIEKQKNPGEQTQKVIDFREKAMKARKPFFKDFSSPPDFQKKLRYLLTKWARKHEKE